VYVHVPFCAHRCHYCDFSVARSPHPPLDEWLACIAVDVREWFALAGWRPPLPLDTLFVGGGTPSLLGGAGMEGLRGLLAQWFTWEASAVEWTAEANPASLSADTAARWRAVGVNRLSLGVQAFDDEVLRWLGRLHDAEGARRAVKRARAAGFDNLSVDLIFGLPEEVPRDWRAEVQLAADLGLEHVSAYGLTFEPHTALGRRLRLGRVRPPPEARYVEEFMAGAEILERAGFEHYEVSNFARPGRRSRHNWHYWDGTSYLGLGPSAQGYLPPHRVRNVHRWDAYRRAAGAGASLREEIEFLTGEQRELERLWLTLRTAEGLPPSDPLWVRLGAGARARLKAWERAGWLTRRGGVRLTSQGWLRMDEFVAELGACGPVRSESEGPGTGVNA